MMGGRRAPEPLTPTLSRKGRGGRREGGAESGVGAMTRVFTASVWNEGDWYVAQALEVDVASQGETIDGALANLREALELYFEPPGPPAMS